MHKGKNIFQNTFNNSKKCLKYFFFRLFNKKNYKICCITQIIICIFVANFYDKRNFIKNVLINKKMKKLVLFAAFVAVVGLSSCTNKAKEAAVEPVQTETIAPATESESTLQEETPAESIDTTAAETVTE